MEKEMTVCGTWCKVKTLGRGGFGIVTLWRNTQSNEYIAVKKLNETELEGVLKAKQFERWCNEVEIMRKLDHQNVVKGLEIPPDLLVLKGNMPLLVMEYCVEGDLRQVLNKPENCSGLKEESVIKILQDVSNGLAYLHSLKIIHRDLKPDNIVLQVTNNTVTYKLIDLGYAKELNKNSVCESFVGTLQYLAPELFLGKQYTNSVDYWSFGIVCYEVITGYRPFLPGYTPANWMKQIKNKRNEVISVIEQLDGHILQSTQLARVNHLSRSLAAKLESWLRLALEWNGEIRGKNPQTKQIILFKELNEILKTAKSLKIFSVPAYEILDYDINAGQMQVNDLSEMLTKDTGFMSDVQILLTPQGKPFIKDSTIMESFGNKLPSSDIIGVFMYVRGRHNVKRKVFNKPLYVRELLDDPKRILNGKDLKRSCSESVYFLQYEHNLYSSLCQAVNVKVGHIKENVSTISQMFEDASEDWTRVEAMAQLLVIAHKTDLEVYIDLRKQGSLPSSGYVEKWIEAVIDVETKMKDIKEKTGKTNMRKELEKIKDVVVQLELQYATLNDKLLKFQELLNDGYKIYEEFMKIPKEKRSGSNSNMAKIIYKCFHLENTALESNEDLNSLFLQMTNLENRIARLVSPLAIWLKSSKIMKCVIETVQTDRQKDIWSLVKKKIKEDSSKKIEGKENFKQKEKKESIKEILNENVGLAIKANESSKVFQNESEPIKQKENLKEVENNKVEIEGETEKKKLSVKQPKEAKPEFSPFHIPKTVNSTVESYKEENSIKPDFKIAEPCLSLCSTTSGHLMDYSGISVDVESIIMDNNQLRYKTQDLTTKCHKMVEEIRSLDWDFLRN